MGKLDSVKLFAAKSDFCGKCKMETSKAHSCCGDEIKIIKIQGDQIITPSSHFITAVEAVSIAPSEFINASFYNDLGSLHYKANALPLLTNQDTFLENCVFRI